MKKWAKVLLVVGIIWLILVVLYFVFACPLHPTTPTCTIELEIMNGCDFDIGNFCLESKAFVLGVLIMGIPAWIMFLIVAIWGRKR